jgi:hypothetical protein
MSTIASKFLYVYGSYFQLTPTLPSPILTDIALRFSPSEYNQIVHPPKTQHLMLNVVSTQRHLQFSQCSGTGATLQSATALPVLCTCIALQSENHTAQNMSTTMVERHPQNPNLKASPNSMVLTIWVLRYQCKVP